MPTLRRALLVLTLSASGCLAIAQGMQGMGQGLTRSQPRRVECEKPDYQGRQECKEVR